MGVNGPRVSSIRFISITSQTISKGTWVLPRRIHPILNLLHACLSNSVLDVTCNLLKKLSFGAAQSTHLLVFSLHPRLGFLYIPIHHLCRGLKQIPKYAFIMWITVRNPLTTRDKLRSLSLNVPNVLSHSRYGILSSVIELSLSPSFSFENVVSCVQLTSTNQKCMEREKFQIVYFNFKASSNDCKGNSSHYARKTVWLRSQCLTELSTFFN
ncbi:unnamed protein product, partial [Thlaspi arvense]